MPRFDQQGNEISEVLAAPLGDLISSVGRGVADAQRALDQQTIENLRLIYQDDDGGMLSELRALGYQPTWYTIPEAEAEIRISLSIQGQADLQQRARQQSVATGPARRATGVKLYASTIDASFANKYDYNVQGASTLRFRITPVPPSPQAENLRFVPQLVKKNLKQAITILADLGIEYDAEGMEQNDEVARTEPAAGEVLPQGKVIRIKKQDDAKDDKQ